MSQKIIEIPIAPHLVKFLEREYPKNGEAFVIRRKIIPPRYNNPKQSREYFTNPIDGHVYIKVLTTDSRLYKLYAWVQHLHSRFNDKMVAYVDVRHGMMYTSVAIRNFLALYNILESEYAYDTAYKAWQRSAEYRSIKEKLKGNARHQQVHL